MAIFTRLNYLCSIRTQVHLWKYIEGWIVQYTIKDHLSLSISAFQLQVQSETQLHSILRKFNAAKHSQDISSFASSTLLPSTKFPDVSCQAVLLPTEYLFILSMRWRHLHWSHLLYNLHLQRANSPCNDAFFHRNLCEGQSIMFLSCLYNMFYTEVCYHRQTQRPILAPRSLAQFMKNQWPNRQLLRFSSLPISLCFVSAWICLVAPFVILTTRFLGMFQSYYAYHYPKFFSASIELDWNKIS